MEGNIPAAGEPEGRGSRAPIAVLVSWARDLSISVVLALIVILFLYQPVKVEGTSMMPALTDQERIFINKFVYTLGLSEVDRGDMVVFWYPSDPSKSFIKRVIGLPGDTIEMTEGTVYVNGEPLDEEYVLDEYRDPYNMAAERVPEDSYFVLGDHRSSSSDSRNWGAVPRRFIYGKAVFVYWPLNKLGLLD